jgi:hypothetical protein
MQTRFGPDLAGVPEMPSPSDKHNTQMSGPCSLESSSPMSSSPGRRQADPRSPQESSLVGGANPGERAAKLMSSEITLHQPELARAFEAPGSRFPGAQSVRYGLPCLNCRLYYSAELSVCPVCHCRERVSPTVTDARCVVRM